MATNAISDMLRQKESSKKSKKGGAKDQLLYWRSLYNWVVSLKILIRENLFYVNLECWESKHTIKFSKGTWHQIKNKFGKERVHREVLSKSVRHMSVVLARRNSRKDHMLRPWSKNDAPAKQRGIWRKIFTSSRTRTKLRLILLLKLRQCQHFPLQKPEEREFVVVSRASMHMMSKIEWSSEEMGTVKGSRNSHSSVDC